MSLGCTMYCCLCKTLSSVIVKCVFLCSVLFDVHVFVYFNNYASLYMCPLLCNIKYKKKVIKKIQHVNVYERAKNGSPYVLRFWLHKTCDLTRTVRYNHCLSLFLKIVRCNRIFGRCDFIIKLNSEICPVWFKSHVL